MKIKEQWKGKNPLGQAWEVVRKNLPEVEEEEEGEEEEPMEEDLM